MVSHSRKQRRKLHAIPAAVALIIFAVMWLSSHRTSADVLLSAGNFSAWEKDCRHCVIEPQYDVLKGEIIRLETRMGEALISAPFEPEGLRPVLTWEWSADEFSPDDDTSLFRVSVGFEGPAGERYLIHYVWQPGGEKDKRTTLDDNEYIWTVAGKEQQARRWYRVERDLTLDLDVLTGEAMEATPVGLTAGLGDPSRRKIKAGGYLGDIAIRYLPEPTPVEPVATSD